MQSDEDHKPIYVFHSGVWRKYGWTRELLSVTTLGDVICDPDVERRDSPAVKHLHISPDARAYVIAAEPPEPQRWDELSRILKGDQRLVASRVSILG